MPQTLITFVYYKLMEVPGRTTCTSVKKRTTANGDICKCGAYLFENKIQHALENPYEQDVQVQVGANIHPQAEMFPLINGRQSILSRKARRKKGCWRVGKENR